MLRTTLTHLRAPRLPSSSLRQTLRAPSSRTPTPLRTFTQHTLPLPRTSRPFPRSTGFTFTSHARPRSSPSILQRLRNLRFFHNTKTRWQSAETAGATAEPTTLGGRLKKLSREYGWSALGIYFLLSALDFPFCYLLVRTLGTDRIGHWEHVVLSTLSKLIPESVKQNWTEWRIAMKASLKKTEHDVTGEETLSTGVEMAGWGVEKADERNKSNASLATQLALAYAIHKSFIFIRVPLTVAVTPKIVKVLRGWGWDIGKRTTKETRAINRTMRQVPKAKGGTPPPPPPVKK